MPGTRRNWLWPFLVLAILASLAAGIFIAARPPAYAGRSIHYWLRHLLDAGAYRAVIQIAHEDLPYLFSIATQNTNQVEWFYKARQWSAAKLKQPPPSSRLDEMLNAGVALKWAKPSFDELEPLIQKRIPLNTPEGTNSHLWLLSCVGDGKEKAVPILSEALRGSDSNAHFFALQTFCEIRLAPDVGVSVLTNMATRDRSLLWPAVDAIGRLRSKGAEALPFLESLYRSETSKDRVVLAISRIQPSHPLVRENLDRALRNDGDGILGMLDPGDTHLKMRLWNLLSQENTKWLYQCRAYIEIAGYSPEVDSILLERLKKAQPDLLQINLLNMILYRNPRQAEARRILADLLKTGQGKDYLPYALSTASFACDSWPEILPVLKQLSLSGDDYIAEQAKTLLRIARQSRLPNRRMD